ncbi:MAG: hypothetical protein E7043_01170 [Lentisphaerae bacterium]|nr:hypothetical protein [Lentisphaerota bacterium]
MGKNIENVADTGSSKQARFHKLFGDASEMYLPASPETMSSLRRDGMDFQTFVLPREYPVVSDNFLPEAVKNIAVPQFEVQPGEFFVFQIMVWAPETGIGGVSVNADSWQVFTPAGNIRAGKVKTFFLGKSFPTGSHGLVREKFIISSTSHGELILEQSFNISGEILSDGGESDDNRCARLRWLNSDIGREDTVFDPYIPLSRKERKITFLGHTVTLDENGLPCSITSNFYNSNQKTGGPEKELLSKPLQFSCNGSSFLGSDLTFTSESASRISWEVSGCLGKTAARLNGFLEFDGFMRFQLECTGAGEFFLDLECQNHEFFMGLGRKGDKAPEKFLWHWDKLAWQDGCFLGNIDGGIKLRLFDRRSHRPLTNCYYHFRELHLPEAWHNNGAGGISIDGSHVRAFSGSLDSGMHDFGFELQITPFKPVNMEKHLRTRTFHPQMPSFADADDEYCGIDFPMLQKLGINRLVLHHGIAANPFINYPFTAEALGILRKITDKAHQSGMEVELYYTVRELSIHPAEFHAFRGMKGEIFFPGSGPDSLPVTNYAGQNPYLKEYLDFPYLPAWGEVIKNGVNKNNIDLALEVTPESRRMENFYLEGLRYLLEKCPLDGLYIDDSALSREGFQRLHRIFRKYRHKAPSLDFHAWNPYEPEWTKQDFGKCTPAMRDMSILPYMTNLWFGESFDYEKSSPDFYLTEISGLLFGLPGQMLSNPNQYRGIVYGMTSRYGWQGEPQNIWTFLDSFGIDGLNFEYFPQNISLPLDIPPEAKIRYSIFSNRDGKKFIALASWDEQELHLQLTDRNWQIETISDFQKATDGQIIIPPGKGVIITSKK